MFSFSNLMVSGLTCKSFVVVVVLFLIFWKHHMPCGILIRWPGIKHKSPEVETWSPNHWTVRENPYIQVFSSFWVNFGIWHKRVVWVHYFACDCPVFLTSFTENTRFSTVWASLICRKFSSVSQLCPTLWDPMDCSTPGFPVLHQLPKLSNSCPSNPWCHPTISSSVILFSSCLQPFPTSGSFPISWLFPLGVQNIGVSASTSILPVNIQDWFPLGLTGLS